MFNNFFSNLKNSTNPEITKQEVEKVEMDERQVDLKTMCDYIKNASIYLDESTIKSYAEKNGVANLDELDYAVLKNVNNYIGGAVEDKAQSVRDNIDKIRSEELPLTRIVDATKTIAQEDAKEFQSTKPEEYISIVKAMETVKNEIEKEKESREEIE